MKLIYITNSRIPSEKANSYQSMQMCSSFSKVCEEVELWIPNTRNTKEFSTLENAYEYYSLDNTFQIKKFFQFDCKILAYLNEFIWANLKAFVFAFNVLIHLVFIKEKVVVYTRDWYLIKLVRSFKKFGFFKHKIYFEAHKYTNHIVNDIKSIDGLVVINNYLKELYQEKEIENILVAHDGVNLDEYICFDDYKFVNKSLYKVYYIGSLYDWKGVYTLIDSLEFVKTKIELICIGGAGEYFTKFKDYIEEKKLNNVLLISHIPKKNVLKYTKNADLLILPNSAKDKMSLFTSPIKLFEYMASKKPIIASNLPSICEVLENGKNAYLFNPDDPIDMAYKIDRALKTDNTKMVNQAFNDVQNYTWDKRAKNIKDFIREVK